MAEVGLSGGDRIEAALKDIADKLKDGAKVRVGFLENARYPDGKSVAQVAAINNFGAPGAGIPPRPFFSNLVAEKSPGWGEKLLRLLRHTNYDAKAALELMGAGIAGQLRQAIVDMNEPPNSMVTNLLKQRFPMGGQTFEDVLQAWADVAAGAKAPAGKPLVHSGHMLQSVDFEVE